jgi:hypothetical protein
LKQLCAGPDGADKPDDYDLRRGILVQDQIKGRRGTSNGFRRAITIAFMEGQNATGQRQRAHLTVTRNRRRHRMGLLSWQ